MISLYDILEASNGQLFGEPGAQIFTSFCTNPSLATSGSLFLALRTDRGDTHLYIDEAIANGADGVICTSPPNTDTSGVSVVIVRDTIDALMAWAGYVIRKTGVKVIAVTGSTGKSLAIQAITQVLETRYSVHKDTIDQHGKISLPLALAGLKPSHDFVVLKLATTHPGEMATMVNAIKPDVGVLTHLGDLSSNTFESTELVIREQETLIEQLGETGLAILNFDIDRVRALANRTYAQIRTLGITSFDADIMAYGTVVGLENVGFDLRSMGERTIAHRIPVLGKQSIYGILSAIAVGLHYEISIEESIDTLSELRPLPGRMNPLSGKSNCLLIDDTYSANTESTLDALDWLGGVKSDDGYGRTIVVLGEMSGSQAKNHIGYRQVGQKAAQIADIIITQGTEASQIARAALDMGVESSNVRTTYSTFDSVSLLLNHYDLNEHDIVLIKGDSLSRMEQTVRALLYDEADISKLVRNEQGEHRVVPFEPTRPSWVEIDRDALANNIKALKSMVGDQVALMAVVKSDAYGHGAIATSQTALLNGATYLGVSSMAEALALREASIEAPTLVMNYTPAYLVRQAIREKVTLSVYELELARAYDRVAREVSGKLRVHVKIDSGMGRLGAMPNTSIGFFRHLIAMQNLEIEGVYTHFSMADEDSDYTAKQIEAFRSIVRPLQATTGVRFKFIHAANSAATVAHPDSHFRMVRTGLAMYGLHPSETVRLPETFKPVMTWKTVVAQVKTLPEDHPIGYGNTYVTTEEERIAVLPIGYSDGFRRAPANWGEVLIHGIRAPIRGRISMEKTVVSIQHIPDVSIGDEVVLLGQQGNEVISAEDIGKTLGTINYEVVTNILPRVPRD